MVHCVVTGATGLVGGTLTRMLLSKGHDVTALGRNTEKLTKIDGAKTEVVDISDKNWDCSFPSNAVWFHCAAALTGADQHGLDSINVEGTRHVIEHFKENSGHLFIFVSSIATYSITEKAPRTENSLQLPFTPYGKSKVAAEKILKDSRIPFVIVRPPFIGGPNDKNVLEEFSRRLETGKLPLVGRNGKLGYVDARDLSKVMIEAMDNEKMLNQAINVQGQAVGFHEFIYLLSEKLGVEPPKHKIPYFLAYLAGLFMEIKNGLRGKSSNRGLSRYRVRTLSAVRCLDTSLLHSLMNFNPIPLENSIEDWLETR